MNHLYKMLAKDAGFIFWTDEFWKPEDATIDWSSNYDKEFQTYSDDLVKQCAFFIQSLVDQRVPASEYANRLKEHFSDK